MIGKMMGKMFRQVRMTKFWVGDENFRRRILFKEVIPDNVFRKLTKVKH